jgi:hypothetical protein
LILIDVAPVDSIPNKSIRVGSAWSYAPTILAVGVFSAGSAPLRRIEVESMSNSGLLARRRRKVKHDNQVVQISKHSWIKRLVCMEKFGNQADWTASMIVFLI